MSETLRISLELGLTLNLGNYQSLKPTLRIDGIDPNGDVEAQIEKAVEAAKPAWGALDKELERAVLELKVGGKV